MAFGILRQTRPEPGAEAQNARVWGFVHLRTRARVYPRLGARIPRGREFRAEAPPSFIHSFIY